MPITHNSHQQASPGVELRNYEYAKFATVTAMNLVTGRPGEICTVTATGVDYQWNQTLTAWVPWHNAGTVLRQNITGAATANVAGRGAAELTLTGNVTGLTISGWSTDNTIVQRVRFQIIQDGTGGRSFAWASVNGVWLETPPATLDTSPLSSSLQFYAITTDGGTTVWLEPIGIGYRNDCVYAQVVEAAVPAVAAGGIVTITHSFAMVGSVDLIEVATGRRVIADWAHSVPGSASSDIEIDFSAAWPANTYTARVVGLASQPCELSVTASEWVPITLAATAATSLLPRVDWTGPANGVQWVWGDGTSTTPTTGAVTTHNYGSAYTGSVVLRYRRGVTITRLHGNSAGWSFNVSAVASLTSLTHLVFQSSRVTGDISVLSRLSALQNLDFGFPVGGASVSGNIGVLVDLPALQQIWLINNSLVAGNIGSLATMPALTHIVASGTAVTGDVADLTGLTNIQQIWLNNTGVNGSINGFAPRTTLTQFRAINTGVSGSVATAFGSNANLTAIQLGNTAVTGDVVAAFVASTGLTILEVGQTGVSGDVGGLGALTLLSSLRMNNTNVTGDPSVVASASAAQLNAFFYSFVGALPTAPQLDAVIAALAAGTVSGGQVNIGGTNPAITNTTGRTTLVGRGWTVVNN